MAYPFVSNSLYEHRQEEVIYEYQKETDKMDTTQIHQMLKEAEEYNVKLKNREAVLTDPFDPDLAVDGTEEKQYEHLSGSGKWRDHGVYRDSGDQCIFARVPRHFTGGAAKGCWAS